MRKSRLHMAGYGFVMAWIVSASVLLAAYYGMMIPDSWEGRLLPALSRVVRGNFMPPPSWDGETYIRYLPLGSCSPEQYDHYVRRYAYQEKERLVSGPKKSFFGEREWTAFGQPPKARPPEDYDAVLVDGAPVEPERRRSYY
ncbi:MAG: hypothetical protein EP347_03170 [Alphaproteobacteria bacterium]|nr:MAG: hypothetical protein EP347_03170 [Alphaproteobacteria bacterium]